MFLRVLLAVLVCTSTLLAQEKGKYPIPQLGPTETYGKQIQRTMGLLASSTAQKRHTVRVLFYGQSITEQDWWKSVAEDLKKRFPHAHLVLENRAIGGFASQLLVKTAETDLYPFYPDLVLFHVYGSHIEYENIIQRIRERTTAEILMQTDHINKDEQLTEETDASKLSPKQWTSWMNYSFLPSTAKKYHCELVDQHNLWKAYLKENNLPPSKLLKDGVHLNEHGCYVMAELTKAYLRYDPGFGEPAMNQRVKTYTVGKEVQWKDGKLRLELEGNRIDLIGKEGPAKPAKIRIDSKKPSEFPECYRLTRTTSHPGSKWPCLLKVGREKPWQIETWTLTLSDVAEDVSKFKFQLVGSQTGPDGEGTSDQKFVSKSGRVVIDPEDWNFAYAMKVFKKPVPNGFQIQWQVLPMFVDTFEAPAIQDKTLETTVTIAQGLPNGKHILEIEGSPETPIAAIRVYHPPGSSSRK